MEGPHRGERHNFLTWFARTFLEGGIKRPDLLESLRKANSTYCCPPKPDSDVRRIARRAYMTREKTPAGRPKAFPISGEKIRALRDEANQRPFSKQCKISTDTLQKAERGAATEKTIRKICKYACKKGQNLTPEDLKSIERKKP